MSEEEKKNKSSLVSSGSRSLTTRSSKLVKRGLELISSVEHQNSEDAFSYMRLGIRQCHLRLYKEAIESYQHAIELNPEYAESYYYLGVLQYKLGFYKEALEQYYILKNLSQNLANELKSLLPLTLFDINTS